MCHLLKDLFIYLGNDFHELMLVSQLLFLTCFRKKQVKLQKQLANNNFLTSLKKLIPRPQTIVLC